jgi:uncharacterized YccA/Bax inhibitor family protein
MATRNPAITRANFSRVEVAEDGAVMTLGGTMRKTFILLAIMSAGMLYVWQGMPGIGLSPGVVYGLFIVGFVVGVGLLLYTTANPQMARATGPLYAAIQGLVLGALTLVLSQNPKYKGLPIAAAALTVATLAVMFVAYRTGAIRVTEKLKTIVVSCTLAIFAFYIIAFVAQLFGVYIPMLHEGGVIGIGFSIFVVALAAFNLLLDFDFIEHNVGHAPEVIEWYAAFALVVTLIWLYTEILRLLRKVR